MGNLVLNLKFFCKSRTVLKIFKIMANVILSREIFETVFYNS